jgi:hypothetical protein
MNTYEQLLYLIRIPFLLLCAFVLAALFTFSAPSLSQTQLPGAQDSGVSPLRADVYAAVVAHQDALYAAPGVIDKAAFTQATASQALVFKQETPHLYAAQATITSHAGEALTDTITYNEDAWSVLDVIRNLRGVSTYELTLPVTLQDHDERLAALLTITVYYET